MERLLAVDIGTRRSGVAFYDPQTAVPLPLDVITHTSRQELLQALLSLAAVRGVTHIVLGYPLLLSGKAGAQCTEVDAVAHLLRQSGLYVDLCDERYTTPQDERLNPDASAALTVLQIWLSRAHCRP